MKNQKTQSKLLVAMSAVILLLVALSATLTFAYFTAGKEASSGAMQFGQLTMGQENGFTLTGDTHSASLTEVVPGCDVTLGGKVSLTGNIKAFVRIKLTVYEIDTSVAGKAALVTEGDNADIPAQWVKLTTDNKFYKITQQVSAYTNPVGTGADKFVKIIYNKINDVMGAGTSDWISYSTDGYLYYKSVLDLNGTSDILVFDAIENDQHVVTTPAKKINFAQGATGNEWQGKKFIVSLGAQAIQAEHLLDDSDDPIILDDDSAMDADDIAALAGAAAWDVDMGTGLTA